MYTPSPHNVPLFSTADEFQFGANIGKGGYNGQMAYSPAQYIGFVANGTYYKAINDSTGLTEQRHSQGDLGIGAYYPFSTNGRMEIFAGYGIGQSEKDLVNMKYKRVFIQPNVGISGRIVDLGFTPGFCWVTHHQTKSGTGTLRTNDKGMFFEPALTFRAGFEQFKFSSQMGFSFPIGAAEAFKTDYKPFMLSFGVHIIIGKDFEGYLR